MKSFFIFSLALVCTFAVPAEYTGYQVLRINVKNEDDASKLVEIQKIPKFDFWTEIIVGKNVDIMGSAMNADRLKTWLDSNNLDWSVMISDVQSLMELEKIPSSSSPSNREKTGHNMDWTQYHPIEEMYGWFDYLETTYDFCETENIGETFEGQQMIVMKVCKGGCGNKPAMWIDSGIHAREWISPAVGTWMLNELVENNADHPDLLDKLDWYFLPSHNPDGYHKSQTDDRLWRKTTTQYESDSCQGTDANRNWDFHWAEAGSSPDSCTQTYHGPEAFSEVEARNVRDFILAHKDNIKFFQTLHSYSQLILFPWGYTSDPAPGYDAMNDLANRGNDALFAAHGKYYEPGCIPCVLYVASGTSLDWALGVAGIPYVYSIELRDTGTYGFLLPPSEIIPTAEETWAWHVVAANQIISEFSP